MAEFFLNLGMKSFSAHLENMHMYPFGLFISARCELVFSLNYCWLLYTDRMNGGVFHCAFVVAWKMNILFDYIPFSRVFCSKSLSVTHADHGLFGGI